MRVLMVAAAFLLPSLAFAESSKELAAIDAQREACIDKDASNNGMKQCTGDAEVAADKLLNKFYASAVAGLKTTKAGEDAESDREILDRLVASERAWVAYRNAECNLQGTEMLGGSGESLAIVACQFSMTKARVKRLDEMFAGK